MPAARSDDRLGLGGAVVPDQQMLQVPVDVGREINVPQLAGPTDQHLVDVLSGPFIRFDRLLGSPGLLQEIRQAVMV